jgi:hypothetical protein
VLILLVVAFALAWGAAVGLVVVLALCVELADWRRERRERHETPDLIDAEARLDSLLALKMSSQIEPIDVDFDAIAWEDWFAR